MFTQKQQLFQNQKMHRFMSRLLTATLAALLVLAVASFIGLVQAGGNKGKGGEEDIIMYNGNIVLRGDKKGGSIVMAGQHPHNEEVEFSPSFFTGGFGEMGGFRR